MEKIDTRSWKKATGRHREVMRQAEWFRAALEHHCRRAGRGTQADITREVGYKHQSMLTWLKKGLRTPDFKQAVKIAYYFGTDLISFLEEGRQLCERPYKTRRRMDSVLPAGRQEQDKIFRQGRGGAKKRPGV